MTKKTADYNSSHIQVRGGLEGVRTNASMYLGSTDASGVFLAVRELLDNALDEYLAGRNKAVRMHADKDGSYWVLDQGTGIPQGVKEVHMHVNGKDIVNKLPTMQAIFGELHTSGKYHSEAYKVSVGTHGIGAKGTNATAEFFHVWTFFKKKWYAVEFARGKVIKPPYETKAPKGPDGKKLECGTCIHFKPDSKIFSVKSFPTGLAHDWAQIMAYLNPGFGIVISDAQGRKVYFSKKGPIEYVNKRITAKLNVERVVKEVFEFKNELADVVVAFTNCEGSEVRGFTNGLHNTEGGTHVDSAVNGLYDGLIEHLVKQGKEKLIYAKPKKGEKGKRALFRASDFKEGLVGLINAKLHKAEFSSQNKAKLTDKRMAKDYAALVVKASADFFGKYPKVALTLAERASKLAALKINFANSKKLVQSLNQLKKKGMPIKYAPPSKSTKPKDREIFIVEGDSAGGSAKDARLKHQGVLPIRGKITNVIKAKGDKGLESEEVMHILGAIGFDPRSTDPYEKLQVGKIICLADPDPDGLHINSLLLGLFYKYLPELFARGMIYVAKSPEFYTIHKNRLFTSDGTMDLRKKLDKEKIPSSAVVNHIKGWGEISANLMKILAMDEKTRTLIQVKKLENSDKEFHLLMAEDVEARKKLLGLK